MTECFVYLLEGENGSTYVGATVNLDRRLRQHNKEIKGGAHATSGQQWRRVAYVSNFPSWQTALQFEWRWKQITRKITNVKHPLHRRLHALKTLLSLHKPTSKAIPYDEWTLPPSIFFEGSLEEDYYKSIV